MKKILILLCGWLLLFAACTKENTVDEADGEHTSASLSEYEKQVVALVNRERAATGLNALEIDHSLTISCDVRAKEIASKFSHVRPGGHSCFTAIKTNYSKAAENIAYGQDSPEKVMKSWMNSAGHKANILGEGFTHIGVGCYKNGKTLYWVQLFIGK